MKYYFPNIQLTKLFIILSILNIRIKLISNYETLFPMGGQFFK